MVVAQVRMAEQHEILNYRLRKTVGMGLTGALLCMLLCTTRMESQAQDVASLMHKMIGSYQRLSSYDGRSNNVDQMQIGPGRRIVTQAITVRFKRPNKLLLVIETAGKTGAHSIYSDGVSLTIYDAGTRSYSVGPTAPTLKEILPLLKRRARVDAELDPLYFLCYDGLPSYVKLQSAVSSQTINRRPCYIVKGSVPPKEGAKNSATMHWTWYIDHQTLLLTKVEAYSDPVAVSVSAPPGKSPDKRTVPVVISLSNTVQMPHLNLNLPDSVFHFTAPAGATRHEPADAPANGHHRG